MSDNDGATSWNILDPRSPLRSKRVQGSFLTLLALGMQALGVNVGEEVQTQVIGQANGILAAVGVIWAQIGAIMASKSLRHF